MNARTQKSGNVKCLKQIYAKLLMEYSIVIKIPFYSEVFALVMIEDPCITLNKAQIVFDLGGKMAKAYIKETG